MSETVKTLLAALIGGGVVAAVINLLGDRWKFRDQRKAEREDREEAKKDRSEANSKAIDEMKEEEKDRNVALEDRLERMEGQIVSLTDAIRLILFDRLVQFGEYLVSKGEVTFDQRHRFGQMYTEYHEVLKGNGDADFLKAAVDRLPMKYSEGEKPKY